MKQHLPVIILSTICIAFAGVNISVFGAGNNTKSGPSHFKQTANMTVKMSGVVDLMHVNTSFNPVLLSSEPDEQQGKPYHGHFQLSKQQSPFFHEDKPEAESENKTATLNKPSVVAQYDGSNGYPNHPPDNFVAVSKAGYVVSVMNSNYRIFQPNNSGTSSNVSFYDALKNTFPTFNQPYFDPRVEYDAVNDRFVMVMLCGVNTSGSEIVILFSKSGNPADGWNTYSIKSDINNLGQFADYPNIGISKSDIFITLTLIQYNFITGIATGTPTILQIDKTDGYKGNSLNYLSYAPDGTNFNVTDNWIPAPHGFKGNYGDSMYFVSNYDTTGSRADLVEITGSEKSGKAKINIDTVYSYSSLSYSPPDPLGEKQDTTHFTLNPDGTWILQAFYLNHMIHYVFHTKDQSTGYADIVYARINLNKKELNYAEFGIDKFSYVYPAMAPIGASDTDKTVLIGYNKCGSSIYPELDAVECDANFNFSPSIVIHAGTSPIIQSSFSSHELRLGDYNGIARQPGTSYCYFSGSYGSSNTYETTVAKLGLVKNSGLLEQPPQAYSKASVFPNPVKDIFTIDFDLNLRSNVNISVFDMQGRRIELLYNGITTPGEQRFSFNKAALKQGIYSLVIQRDGDEMITRKIVVE